MQESKQKEQMIDMDSPIFFDEDEPKNDIKINSEKPVTKSSKKAKKKTQLKEEALDGNTIYLGRLPHGFYENEIKGYFSQFGDVTRVRVSRNKKTGNSKHYGFVEFADAEVAKIAAETMDKYLLMGRILSCKIVRDSDIHPDLWKGANRKFKSLPLHKMRAKKHNAPKTAEKIARNKERLLKREGKLRAKMKNLGIDYDFPGYQASAKSA